MSTAVSSSHAFATTPLQSLAPAVLAQLQIQTPAAYDAIVATEHIFNSCRDALGKKEVELARCVDVGQDVLNQLNGLHAHCAAQDAIIVRTEKQAVFAESKRLELEEKIESLEKDLAVANARVTSLTAAAATSFTDPATATTLGKAQFLQEELNQALDALAVKDAKLVKESALVKAAEVSTGTLERDLEELRAENAEYARQLSMAEGQRATMQEAHLGLELVVARSCEMLSAIQAKRAVLLHQTSSAVMQKEVSASAVFTGQGSPRKIREEFIVAERVTMPTGPNDLPAALSEVDNHYAILQLLIPQWRGSADTGRDDVKVMKHALEVSRRENELLKREVKVLHGGGAASSTTGSVLTSPLSTMAAAAPHDNSPSPTGKPIFRVGGTGGAASTRSVSTRGRSPRSTVGSEAPLDVKTYQAMQRSLNKAEDKIQALELQLLEHQQESRKDAKRKVRMIRHEELATAHFNLQNSEETNKQLKTENLRLRSAMTKAGVAPPSPLEIVPTGVVGAASASQKTGGPSGLRAPAAHATQTLIKGAQTEISGPVIEKSLVEKRRQQESEAAVNISDVKEQNQAEVSLLRAEFNAVLESKDQEKQNLEVAVDDLQRHIEDLQGKLETQHQHFATAAAIDESKKSLSSQVSNSAAPQKQDQLSKEREARLQSQKADLARENEQLRQQLAQQITATENARRAAAAAPPTESVATPRQQGRKRPPLSPQPEPALGSHRYSGGGGGGGGGGYQMSEEEEDPGSLLEVSVIQREALDPYASPPNPTASPARQRANRPPHDRQDHEAPALPIQENWSRAKEEEFSNLRDENVRLSEALEDLKAETQQLQQSVVEVLQQQQQDAEQLVSSPKAVIIREKSTEADHEAIGIYKNEIELRNKRLEMSEVENADLTHRLHQLESEIRASTAREERTEKRLLEERGKGEQHRDDVENLRERISDQEHDLKSVNHLLEEQLHETEKLNKELAEFEERWAAADRVTETIKEAFQDYKLKHRTPLSVQEDLEADCNRLREELANARKDALSMQQVADEKDTQMANLAAKLNTQKQSHDQIRDHIAESMTEIQALSSHCDTTHRSEASKMCEFFADLLVLIREPLKAATYFYQPDGQVNNVTLPNQSSYAVGGDESLQQFDGGVRTPTTPGLFTQPRFSSSRGGANQSHLNRSAASGGGVAVAEPVSRTQMRLNDVVAVINQSEDVVVALRDDLRKRDLDIQELNEKLKSNEFAMVTQGKHHQQMDDRLKEAEDKFDAKVQECRGLELKLEERENAGHERDMQIRKLNSALERSRKDAVTVAEELDEINDKYSKLQDEKAILRKKVLDEQETLKAESEQQISALKVALKSETEKFNSIQERYDEERSEMHMALSNATNQHQATSLRLEQTEAALQTSRQLLEEANRMVLEVGELDRMEHEDLKTRYEVLEKVLHEKEAELEHLRLEKVEWVRERGNQREEVSYLQSQLENNKSAMKAELERSTAAAVNDRQQSTLKKQLEQSVIEAAQMKAERDALGQEVAYLKSQLEALQSEKRLLQRSAEADTLELKARIEQVQQLETRCSMLERDSMPLRARLQDTLIHTGGGSEFGGHNSSF